MRSTRAPAVVFAFAVMVMVLAGCGDDDDPGPGEDALLPAAELTYPGATETRRSFRDARSGRYIDGDTYDDPASFDRELTLAEPTPQSEVLAWYQTQLEDQGWANPSVDSFSLRAYRDEPDVSHQFSVAVDVPESGPATGVTIQYTMN